MTSREITTELRYLRFRCAQIDAASHALERLQFLRSTRSWKIDAIPTAPGVGRPFPKALAGRAGSG
jgi:hypothetical protein